MSADTLSELWELHALRDPEWNPEPEPLDDPAMVDIEFFAIMRASGFGDRVIVSSLIPRPTRGSRGDEPRTEIRPRQSVALAWRPGERVRSPPTRRE
jgi:hypothetical protein